ncbi:hypothetical protein GCM10007859_09900 [Brevundimonas denitrificans]|uniref:Uncharacterized protein n=1 Tax=Brevundimonas denitrificans TaxID=1443434 RepID=A0ABQ6BIS7_9CAUL|nr:hypothetical protein [Brevundimonas denitrificans]GLS00980.1 hypothetical protein GCM10007859_09900 [Brevundimonas denitrificans]
MFGKVPRRNNRKIRLSAWFARERDGDMQAFDVDGVASGVGVWFNAVMRDRARRRSTRAASEAA